MVMVLFPRTMFTTGKISGNALRASGVRIVFLSARSRKPSLTTWDSSGEYTTAIRVGSCRT